MADLGDVLGSLMTGLLRARRMADEQTAALAEYYKGNPLLEGLSVPRIRIPELTIDMPFLIEDHKEEQAGEMAPTGKIVEAASVQLRTTLERENIRTTPTFLKAFQEQVAHQLDTLQASNTPVMKETVARSVQAGFVAALSRSKSSFNAAHREAIAKDLRERVAAVAITRQPLGAAVHANIRTADVKEQTSTTSVVRLKVTMKEEGLEWATQISESGGVVRTLQPE